MQLYKKHIEVSRRSIKKQPLLTTEDDEDNGPNQTTVRRANLLTQKEKLSKILENTKVSVDIEAKKGDS